MEEAVGYRTAAQVLTVMLCADESRKRKGFFACQLGEQQRPDRVRELEGPGPPGNVE